MSSEGSIDEIRQATKYLNNRNFNGTVDTDRIAPFQRSSFNQSEIYTTLRSSREKGADQQIFAHYTRPLSQNEQLQIKEIDEAKSFE